VKIFVAILLIAAVPAYAQAQSRSTPKTGDAQKVAKIIRSDKAKIQTYCEINKVSDEMNQAYGKNDKKRVDELSQKIERLEKILGPEYVALMDGFSNSARKTKSALRTSCCNSQHSTGCVRGKSRKSEELGCATLTSEVIHASPARADLSRLYLGGLRTKRAASQG
jgi:hypothetical protein